MKRIILFLSLILCFSAIAIAQSVKVKQANELYAKGNYTVAIKLYEKVLSEDGVAPELFFNLGNAYYKSNEIGKSILNYERSLRLSPMNEDAQINLEIAQQKVVDNVIQPPSFFLGHWIEKLILLLNSNQWLFISFLTFLASLVLTFLFLFANSLRKRKISFYTGTVLLTFSIIMLVFSGVRKKQLTNHNQAIVMTGAVSVKSSPDYSGTDLFQLHEGTKVEIKSTLENWVEIQLGNGNVGWVQEENVEKI